MVYRKWEKNQLVRAMSNTLLTLFDTDRYHEHYRTGLWRDDTIYALVRAHSEKAPERIALRSAQGDLTYGTLIIHVDAFASDLGAKRRVRWTACRGLAAEPG